jgi:hypothetical protein
MLSYKAVQIKWPSILLYLILMSGCSAMNMGESFFRSTDDFLIKNNDGRIFYEPGAENLAVQLQPYLDDAIATVEDGHHRKFPQPVVVQICAHAQRFSALSGTSPKANGAVHPTHGLLLNASLFTTPQLIKGVLTHELSHLLMRQQLGFSYYASAPAWFHEGFAEMLANSSQLDKVSEPEARTLILSGRLIQAKDSGSFFSYDTSESFGDLPYPRYVFYRQSVMFVSWLKQRDEAQFKKFLLSIQDGTSFHDAFHQSFGGSVEALQIKYIKSLKTS